MSCWKPDSWWELVGGIVAIMVALTFCTWCMSGIYKYATELPAPPKTAQQRFEDNCTSSYTFDFGQEVYGLPNTTNPDPTKWTCVWPHQ